MKEIVLYPLLLPEMSHLLYLDTSGSHIHLMVFTEKRILSMIRQDSGNNHASQIIPLLNTLMEQAACKPEELDAIAVLNGPGSYTGLRIALSAAKAICLHRNIPLILLSNLDLISHAVSMNAVHMVVLKARILEYFVGIYDQEHQHILNPVLMHESELLEHLERHSYPCFTNQEEFQVGPFQIQGIKENPETIQHLVLRAFDREEFADLGQSEPFYLKKVHINKINKL
jgi:tRNA threonylcarbamoyladenosine biosynthesis protein TsaB